jgi:subtilisin
MSIWVIFLEEIVRSLIMWRVYVVYVLCMIIVVGGLVHRVQAQVVEPGIAQVAPEEQQVIIVLKSSLGIEAQNANVNQRLTRSALVRQLQATFLQRKTGIIRTVNRQFTLFPMIAATIATKSIATLQADPLVESVQIDRLSPVNLNNSTELIGSVAANSAGYGGGGTTVAVLDTGVDKNHPFLAGKVIQEACFSSTNSLDGSTSVCPGGARQSFDVDSGLPCPENFSGCDHGTHVAGIVAGNRLYVNGATISGVAPDAKIIAVQIFSGFKNTSDCVSDCALTYGSDQIAALEWLYLNRNTPEWHTLAAVNMSLGSDNFPTFCDGYAIQYYIDQLRSVGIATVIAAGNDGYTDAVSFPGCVSSAITVGSTWSSNSGWIVDNVSAFSNAPTVANNMPNSNGDRLLDLLAPGEKIYSSVGYPANTYEEKAGTSMATPHVAGAWAVLKGLMPDASVAQVLTWLRDNGLPVADQRMAAAARLVVPRIQVGKAVTTIQNATHILQLSTSALDFGQVRVGDSVTRQIIATSPYTSTTFTWNISGAGFAVDVPDCVDYIDYSCALNVTYTPSSATNNINDTGVLTVTWGGVSQAIGLLGRSVLDLSTGAQTQTVIAAKTSTALKIRSVTPTPTPTSHGMARTVVAWATRTQRMRNYQATTVRQTWTALVAADRQTATKERQNGLPSRTRTQTATQTATATVLPLTKTLGAVTTATRVQQLGLTATRIQVLTTTRAALVALTSTRQQENYLATQEATLTGKTRTRTATITQTPSRTWTASNTRVTNTTTRTPSRTWTASNTRVINTTTRTSTRTHTSTRTLTASATATVTPEFITQSMGVLDQPYQAMLALPTLGNLVGLHQGDIANADTPQLAIIDPQTMTSVATQNLIGINGRVMTIDPRNPLQIIVAGRLNWQSNYVQIYDVSTSAFVLLGEFTFVATGDVTALYAANQRLYVGVSVPKIPSPIATGQIISIDISDPQTLVRLGLPIAVVGIPNAIVGIDDGDSLVAIAGSLPQITGVAKGFVQGLQRRSGVFVATTSVTLPYAIQTMALRSTLVALQRTNILYAGDSHQLTQLTIADSTGAVVKSLNPLLAPATAAKYIPVYDILVTAYYDATTNEDVFVSYQLWQKLLWVHTRDRNSNLVVPPFPAITLIDQTLYALFGDHVYVSPLGVPPGN